MHTCYITFGQRYAREAHPVDGRAHPDGWFEYTADTYADAIEGARRHLLHNGVPLYAFDYDEHDIQRGYHHRGCLARFEVREDGSVVEVEA